jgi:hypothetical protein
MKKASSWLARALGTHLSGKEGLLLGVFSP